MILGWVRHPALISKFKKPLIKTSSFPWVLPSVHSSVPIFCNWGLFKFHSLGHTLWPLSTWDRQRFCPRKSLRFYILKLIHKFYKVSAMWNQISALKTKYPLPYSMLDSVGGSKSVEREPMLLNFSSKLSRWCHFGSK